MLQIEVAHYTDDTILKYRYTTVPTLTRIYVLGLGIFRLLLARDDLILNQRDMAGRTAKDVAVAEGRARVVKLRMSTELD